MTRNGIVREIGRKTAAMNSAAIRAEGLSVNDPARVKLDAEFSRYYLQRQQLCAAARDARTDMTRVTAITYRETAMSLRVHRALAAR